VSEALLQQTQVVRVAERFPEFMRLFPTPAAMARAGEGAVLKAWRGLGYYRRARSLHAAACAIVQQHRGKVPSEAAELRQLPGVGRYTAGAVASIAFGRREAIVDGNVARVLSRLADRRASAIDREGQAWCWRGAERLVQVSRDPAVLNEALMELGATVCTPAAPRCDACPVRACCRSRRAGSQSLVPPPKPAAPRKALVLHALVHVGPRGVALQRRREGLWNGLLFPPLVQADERVSTAELARAAGARRVHAAAATVPFETTHRSVRFIVHRATFGRGFKAHWVSRARLSGEALPSAALRVIEAALATKA
jgi:A/G-specific adenine glycosylase